MRIIAVILALGLFGCASYFKRQECEATNWYQYGYDVAMAGKRLDADDHVKQCQKVEAKMSWTELDTGFKSGMAKYCTSDNVFAVGKAGKPFSYDLCDGESVKKMRVRYEAGLAEFCVPANGYRFGSAGGIYQNVCPRTAEEDWLTEYRRGRKVYLGAVIEQKEREIANLTQEIVSLRMREQTLQIEKASLVGRSTFKSERVLDAATGTYREQVSQVPDEQAAKRTEQLNGEISIVGHEIRSVESKRAQLSTEASQMRTEMIAL